MKKIFCRLVEEVWGQVERGEPRDIRISKLTKTVSLAAEKIALFIDSLIVEKRAADELAAKAKVVDEWVIAHPEIQNEWNAKLLAARLSKEKAETVEEVAKALTKSLSELVDVGLIKK